MLYVAEISVCCEINTSIQCGQNVQLLKVKPVGARNQ